MKIAMIALLLLPAFAQAGPDEDAAAAIAIALAQSKKPQPKAEPVTPRAMTYTEGMAAANETGKPLVVFVGTKSRDMKNIANVVVCEAPMLDGYPKECIVVTYPGGLAWFATLDSESSYFVIDRAVNQSNGMKEVSRTAVPFRPGEVAIADDSESVAGRLSFLNDLVPYTTAKNTQITFRRWSGYIGPSPRSSLQAEWQVPGGLVNAHGWSSRLLKSRNAVPSVFLVRQDPSDGNSAVTWSRSYPDGSVFADELRNEHGKVFEVRVAEKHDGKWDRYVVYRNYSEAPKGFNRFKTSQCNQCHEQAGVSAYGGAAIPGADTILSEPIDIIERGETVQGGYGTSLR